ncbi:MAG: NAD(P)H-quinone oxidoreductase [Pseudomonadota bacterium]
MPMNAKKMRAISIAEPGGPEVLVLGEHDIPVPKDAEVLIEVAFAGVNRPDILQRTGAYPPPKNASPLPGLEVSGKIVAVGAGADQNRLGETVCALVPGGGYAEYCPVRADHTLPVPKGTSLRDAACLPETTFTVWHNLFQRGGLREGDWVLIHGGASGIGTTALQLAKARGAHIIVTAGSQEKCNACLTLGADAAINYRDEDFVAVVKEITDGYGADVILDMVGGDYVTANYKAAAMDGTIVQIAFLGGARTEANFVHLMTKRLTHTGSTLRARDDRFKADLAQAVAENVWPFVEDGQMRVVFDSEFALAEASLAHERMESGDHIGKIVLAVR